MLATLAAWHLAGALVRLSWPSARVGTPQACRPGARRTHPRQGAQRAPQPQSWAIARGLASLAQRVAPLSLFCWSLSKYIEATRLNFQRKPPRAPRPASPGLTPLPGPPVQWGCAPRAHSAVSVIPQGEATWPVNALLLTLGLFPP